MVRISRDGRAGRGQESRRRSVLCAEGSSRREHKRRSEKDFFPLARGCAEKLPAGYGSPTGGKEVGRSRHRSKGAFMKNKVLLVVCGLPVVGKKKDSERINQAATVIKEILGMPDGIPKDVLDKADCIVIFPSVKKAAFIVGGSYGRGLITCHKGQDFKGRWSAPAMFALEGGSFGLQIGAQATDFVLLVMNESGANSVMSSK